MLMILALKESVLCNKENGSDVGGSGGGSDPSTQFISCSLEAKVLESQRNWWNDTDTLGKYRFFLQSV